MTMAQGCTRLPDLPQHDNLLSSPAVVESCELTFEYHVHGLLIILRSALAYSECSPMIRCLGGGVWQEMLRTSAGQTTGIYVDSASLPTRCQKPCAAYQIST